MLLLILANYIAPAEYGQLSLFNTVVMFVSYFTAMSTEGYVDISYFKQDKEKFKSDITAIISIGLAVSTVLFFIVLVFGNWLGEVLDLSRNLLFIAIVISLCQVLYRIALSFRRVREEVVKYGIMSCGYAILHFGVSLLLVVTFRMDWLGRVYAQLGCVTLFAILSVVIFSKQKLFCFTFNKDDLKRILFWGIPLIPHVATTWLRQGCDRYIINYHYELVEVGLFSFALNMANVIEMIGSAFNSTNSVNIFKTLSRKDIGNEQKVKSLRKQSREMLIIYVIASLLVVIGGVVLIPLLIPKYVGSIPIFLLLAVYGLFRCVYYIYCNYLFYWDLNKALMYITFGSAVFHLGLSLIFTRFSLLCTAAIYVVTQIMINIFVIAIAKKRIKVELS